MSEPLVKLHHVRAAGLCASGLRAWAHAHAFDIRRLRQGVPASEIEAMHDALADRVVACARREAGRG